MKNERFLVLDGNALVHRAYHALPPLTTKDGLPIGAVFGFFSMFLKLFQEYSPDYVAVCFDRPKPTFRQTLFVGYQAQRPKMAEDLSDQIKVIHQILADANIAVYEVDGFEADDVIGTIAAAATANKEPRTKNDERRTNNSQRSAQVIIVSGDRDMLQLVGSRVKVLMPITGITKMVLYHDREVREKFGIEPFQIIDYKALVGDASDNYSGVPGVGPKTAASLIKKYGSLDEVYKNLDKIEQDNPNLAKKLVENHDSAILAKTLAAIVKDVPFVFKMSDCRMSLINKKGLEKAFEKYAFKSLLKRFAEVFGKEENKEENLNNQPDNQLKLIN